MNNKTILTESDEDDILDEDDEGLPYLKVGALKEMLKDVPDNINVYIRCCYNLCGNTVEAGEAKLTTYGFFGKDISCVIIEPADDCYRTN